jgi:hypothetical protein
MNTQQALALFDSLETIDTTAMLGTWAGEEFPSGHPMDGALAAFGWRGKRFDSEEHVHPLLFGPAHRTFTVRPRWVAPGLPLLLRWPALKQAAPLVRALLPLLATRRSRARLRMVHFRGRLSATMVYDEVPIQDVFRRLEHDAVLGLMDMKGMAQPFFFVLRRAGGPTMQP